MGQPETTTNPLFASSAIIPITKRPVNSSSRPSATTITAPETQIMEVTATAAFVPANAPSPPAAVSPEEPYDSVDVSAFQAARVGQLQVGFLHENTSAPNSSAPRHTVARIWPKPEAVSPAETDRDEGCGLKHFFWACVGGTSYLCCMT